MPYNGSGSFVPLPLPTYPAVAGDVIYAARFNAVIDDIIAGLGQAVTRDGQSTVLANIPMNGFRLTGLSNGMLPADSLTYGQWINGFTGSVFTNITVNTPSLAADNLLVTNTTWVRQVFAAAAALNLPPANGKEGQVLGVNAGPTIAWRPAVPDFIFMNQGII